MMMYSCKQVARLKTQAGHRPLTVVEQIGLRIHYLMCAGCRQVAKQMEFLQDASAKFFEHIDEGAQGKLSDDARQRIQNVLTKEQNNST